MDMEGTKKWFAAYTKARNEKKVYERLIDENIETYLPLQRKLKQWSDRKKWVEEPLFRSYIFVHITQNEYYKVLNTNGIVRFITFEGKAVAIPEKQIETIRLLLVSEVDFEVTNEKFEKGDKIKVRAGIMMGIEGELIDFIGRKRVLIRIEEIGQSLIINLPIEFVETR